MSFNLQFEIQSDFQYLPFLTRLFKALRINRAPRLTQILVEAYNNAVIHGHKGKKEKWVGIEIDRTQHRTKIRIVDEGKGLIPVPSTKYQVPSTLWNTKGRGLELIHALAKQVSSKKKNGKHIFTATV